MISKLRQVFLPCLLISIFLVTSSYVSAENVAYNKPVIASCSENGQPAEYAVDGDLVKKWAGCRHGTPSNPVWLYIDLEDVHIVDQIDCYGPTLPAWPGYTWEYNIYALNPDKISNFVYSEVATVASDSDWTLIASGILVDTYNTKNNHTIEDLETRYLRYEVVGGSHWGGLNEIKVNESSDYDKGYNVGYKAGRQACIKDPSSCHIQKGFYVIPIQRK